MLGEKAESVFGQSKDNRFPQMFSVGLKKCMCNSEFWLYQTTSRKLKGSSSNFQKTIQVTKKQLEKHLVVLYFLVFSILFFIVTVI